MRFKATTVATAVVCTLVGLDNSPRSAFADEYIFGGSPSGVQQLILNGSITLNAANTGWYDETGFHSASNLNYIAGVCCGPQGGHNDYFVFNLAGISTPILSATLS